MSKQKYVIANLIYDVSTPYPMLWLENQLKSLCDPTNLPALREKYDVDYVILSDEDTIPAIVRHPNFIQLSKYANTEFIRIGWPADAQKFENRYVLLTQMLQTVIPVALEQNAIVSAIVADLVFAQGSIPRILGHMERGHDAVFNVPIRGAADGVQPVLRAMPGAPTSAELFKLAYEHMHPLWVAADWNARRFSKFPYSMLWDSGTGLVGHNFGVTPIAFRPNEAMRDVQGGIDSGLPALCQNPYWATDWTDAAVAGIEPLSNGHYPPWALPHEQSSVETVVKWAQKATIPAQDSYLNQALYYPDRVTFANNALAADAENISADLQRRLSAVRKAATV